MVRNKVSRFYDLLCILYGFIQLYLFLLTYQYNQTTKCTFNQFLS